MPIRVQRRRTKGWKMPENTVYVGRPSKWGNPFYVGHQVETAAEAVEKYVAKKLIIIPASDIIQLRGKNLCCWCPLGKPCHADVLLKLANQP